MTDSTNDALVRLLKLADSNMLMVAASDGDLELVQRILLCLEPSIALQTTEREWTACMVAASKGHAQVCEVLLKAHRPEQQVMQGDYIGVTAAMDAACDGHIETFMQLMAYAPQQQLTLTSIDGRTILQHAAVSNRAEIVCEVLGLAADPQQLVSHSNKESADALSLAAFGGSYETLQLLLPYTTGTAQLTKALQSMQSPSGSNSHKRCCQLLFARGASQAGLEGKQRQCIEAALRESVAVQ